MFKVECQIINSKFNQNERHFEIASLSTKARNAFNSDRSANGPYIGLWFCLIDLRLTIYDLRFLFDRLTTYDLRLTILNRMNKIT